MVLGTYKLIELLDRSKTGPVCKVEEFDIKVLPGRIKQLVEEYDIKYDPSQLVYFDNSFLDDVYNAGRDLLLDLGVLCMDTKRLIKFTEEELKEALRVLPLEVTVGAGRDARQITHREMEDPKPPSVLGGPAGGLLSPGQPYVDIMTSVAMEPIVDVLSVGSVKEIEGRPVLQNSPLEMQVARCEAVWMREATARAGRPGMALSGPSPEWVAADMATSNPEIGFRPTDIRATALLTSLKTDYTTLSKVKHFLDYNTSIYAYFLNFIGGYTGGPEGNAITSVASHLANVLVNQATFQAINCPHLKYVNTTNRMSLWAQNVSGQAIVRNTSIITHLTVISSAGPCTKMILNETAAVALGSCGGPNVKGVLATGSRELNRYSGLENRFMGEVGHAASGMRRDTVNEIIIGVLKGYEDRFEQFNFGKTFQECYDIRRMRPTDEWQNIYNEVKKELDNLGLKFR
jgi:methylamine--corrinoid protein Co-methyltransferase